MQKTRWITVLVLWLAAGSLWAQTVPQVVDTKNDASLDARQEQRALESLMQIVKHFSATNHILAAAALGEEPPAEAGDELGPESVRTKAEIVAYLKGSFVHLDKAVEAIGQANIRVNASPISPLKPGEVTR